MQKSIIPSQGPMNLQEVLEIARRLVESAGVDGLTMEALAEAAGISRSSAYRLVGSREALLDQLAAIGVDVGARGDVRARVLEAATGVFARHGLDGATMEAIAEAAGVGTATVYRHFGDKKGLLSAYLATLGPRHAMRAAVRELSSDLRADLERLARTALEQMTRNEPLMRLMMLEQLRGSTLLSELASSPDRTIHGLATLFRHHIARGGIVDEDPYRLARAFQGMVMSFGLFGAVWALPGDVDPERDARFVVDIFLRGVQRGAP